MQLRSIFKREFPHQSLQLRQRSAAHAQASGGGPAGDHSTNLRRESTPCAGNLARWSCGRVQP